MAKTTVARFNSADYNTAWDSSNRVTIGAYWNGSAFNQCFDGDADEVAIFPAALTDEQILAHETAHTLGTFGSHLTADKTGRYPRAKLEMALDSNPTDACLAFTDITADLRNDAGVRLSYGRNNELDRLQAGQMDFALDNRDRAYNDLAPARAVRFRAQVTTDGPVYSRFFGYTDGPRHLRPATGKDAVITLTATDLFKTLAADKVRETLVRPTELPGVRLEALLEQVPHLRFLLDEGHHKIISADLQGTGRLEHAQSVAETDGGIFFASPDGILIFQDNQYRSVNSGTVQATFGWVGTTATMFCESFEPEVDEQRLYTAAMVTPASGEVQIAINEIAAASFFERTRELTTLHAFNRDALAMAHHYANVYSNPVERVEALRLQPGSAASVSAAQTMWSTVFGLNISERIETIEKPLPLSGAEVDREHFIEGVSEMVNSNDWRVSFQLSPVELEGNRFVIDLSAIDSEVGIVAGGGYVIGW